MTCDKCGDLFHHEAVEGDCVKSCECFGVELVIFDEVQKRVVAARGDQSIGARRIGETGRAVAPRQRDLVDRLLGE